MSWIQSLMFIMQIIAALLIIILVLIQQGSGSDMGPALGSASAGSLFGSSGSANFLSRTTAFLAILFFVSTLVLTYLSSKKPELEAGVVGSVQQSLAKDRFLKPKIEKKSLNKAPLSVQKSSEDELNTSVKTINSGYFSNKSDFVPE